jgi:diacylglycerol kinase (ATP)
VAAAVSAGQGDPVGRIYKAFLNSCAGFAFGLRTERAIRQEFALLVLGIPAAYFIGPSVMERITLILSLVAILCVEFLNTAIEKLCDHVTPERHEHIRAIKDMGSAACFCAQFSGAVIWLFFIFARI